MNKNFKSFKKKVIKGATMIEYVMIIALIAVASSVIIGTVGTTIKNVLTTVKTSL